jgi:hypothetical protein
MGKNNEPAENNAGYFIEQIGSHADYSRKLYNQIEFPYGPLIFYGPIFLRTILSPFHVSLTGAYFSTLVLEHVIGLLLVAYIVDGLPLRSNWKTMCVLICAPAAIELSFGLNFRFFRFTVSAAILVLNSRIRRPSMAALCLLTGQIISFSTSPEMGFAFAVAGATYAPLRVFSEGRDGALRFSLHSQGQQFSLRPPQRISTHVEIFARGLCNFIVEPLPPIEARLCGLYTMERVNLINLAVPMVDSGTGRAHDTLYFSQWDLNCSIWFRVKVCMSEPVCQARYQPTRSSSACLRLSCGDQPRSAWARLESSLR